jgi:TolA-binding protein
MTIPLSPPFARKATGALLAAAVIAAVPLAAPLPALAQERAEDARIRKLEAEVRALQRKVFPGGDARLFEPQIPSGGQPAASTAVTAPVPAASALTDVLARLDALELQMQRLTERSEEQANALGELERRLTALEAGSAGGAVLTGAATGAPTALPPVAQPSPAPTPAPAAATTATAGNLAAMSGTAPARAPTPAPAAAAAVAPAAAGSPNAARLAAVQAIAKPQTEDPGDDEYSYGFRLWSAGFFPEARQQLSQFVEKYPKHRRISFGRNLLGRAFLDDGKPEDAARWFLRNYQADKNGERAPDSLLYLANSMIALKDTRKACIALAEFSETYPLIATGRLGDEYKASLAKVKCS